MPDGSERNWDGSVSNVWSSRRIRIHDNSPSRLLRKGQQKPCKYCGNLVEWFERTNDIGVPLVPHSFPADRIPMSQRWHVYGGVAYAAWDGSAVCRIAHPAVCPADPTLRPEGLLRDVLLRYRAQMNTLIEKRGWVPDLHPADASQPSATVPPRERHVVMFLSLLYLAEGAISDVQCVAQTKAGERCRYTLAQGDPGFWIEHPIPDSGRNTLSAHLVGTPMMVYSLQSLNWAGQSRWRDQRCELHGSREVPAMVASAWERFDPFIHIDHIRRPKGYPEESPTPKPKPYRPPF
ncbi:DUF6083 domain-containing protein [Streptomyces sp. NPDC059894]|uniref:DUF6083 domain-containing protein n=1 Tax=unclassified Streptomyces TaxID=2593676 RepID=UPI0036515D4D